MAITEEETIEKAIPYLKQQCIGRWCNLEYEDRVGEMLYIFLCALRKLPVNSGHFLQDFQAVAKPYMDEVNRRTPSLRYGFSLDADLRTKKGGSHYNAHCILADRDYMDSRLYVKFFLESLPEYERDLIWDLLSGTPKNELAFAYGLDNFQLYDLLEDIGSRYLEEYGIN